MLEETTALYEKDGEKYFVVDGHVHYWDASPDNRNKYGEGFINCFYDYQKNLRRLAGGFPILSFRLIYGQKREPTSGLEPLTCSLRVSCSTS